MCPLCVSTLMLAALGTASAGGVTAAVVKRLRSKRKPATPERRDPR
jgi:hypothetical protein